MIPFDDFTHPLPASSQSLIERLVTDAHPVRAVVFRRLLGRFVVADLAVAAIAAVGMGVGDDEISRASEVPFLVMTVAVAAAGLASAAAALQLAIPGREPTRAVRLSVTAMPAVLALVVVVAAPWGRAWPGWSMMAAGCWACTGTTVLASALPLMLTVGVLGRLAMLHVSSMAGLAALSALLMGATVTGLQCGVRDAYHLAFAHYLPVSALAVVCVAVAAATAGRRECGRRS